MRKYYNALQLIFSLEIWIADAWEINRIAKLVPCEFITKILHAFYNNFIFLFLLFLPWSLARLQWTTHSTAHPNTVLHISDGGQRNIEDSIHHAVPIMGISYSSSLEHYLYQIEKFDCGIISYVDYDSQRDFESKIDDLLNSKKWVVLLCSKQRKIKRHDLGTSRSLSSKVSEFIVVAKLCHSWSGASDGNACSPDRGELNLFSCSPTHQRHSIIADTKRAC